MAVCAKEACPTVRKEPERGDTSSGDLPVLGRTEHSDWMSCQARLLGGTGWDVPSVEPPDWLLFRVDQQHLENVTRKGVLPHQRHDCSMCVLDLLFCLASRGSAHILHG